jgi:hypothetical protein
MTSSEQTKRDSALEDPSSIDEGIQDLRQVYGILPEDDVTDYEKRRSLMRFGKRRSLMRFGKRRSIMRFGKRPSIMRFGKRAYDDDDDSYDFIPEDVYNFSDDLETSEGFPSSKRGSIMRFGKRPSIMRFGRSEAAKEKKPHVPWRFGKDLDIIKQY